ncbi:MAG: bifunctional demethylmenaquinone methyltransferase/2-methoxy-6-polyprenyl-1,4-benzoquinol methylase UbiE [Nitrospiraceae bacterium]
MLQPQKRPVAGPPAWAVPDWPGQAKEQAVQRMFTSIARFYDLNNSLLSFGFHHRWKHTAIEYLTAPPASACGGAELRDILDLGAGTGDLALLVEKRLGQQGHVVAVDLNAAMLRVGVRKIARRGLGHRIACLRATAERLGFRDASFDAVTTGFCIRNVGDLMQTFSEIRRVLKPGGRLVCLEFSRPVRAWLRALYDWYSLTLLPRIGTFVARDKTGVYRYLPDSIRTFPDQEALKDLLLKAGFRQVEYRNLSGGIVAIHVAVK